MNADEPATRPERGDVLSGVRVVAIEQAVAAPLCSRHLADLGADVIKIERPGRGDFARHYDTLADGLSAHYVWLNHGKRSVVLDLKDIQDQGLLNDLLADCDVLLSNLGVGVIDRLIDLTAVRARNPRLISCAISGYGPDGPYASRKAYDLLVVGEAGITANTGTLDEPAKPAVSLADLAGGIYAMAAICAALHERDRTGQGRHVDISMFDVMCEWMMPLLMTEQLTGRGVPPMGTRHATITPYGPYTCAGGETLNIAVQNDEQWHRLCKEVLNDPDLATDPALATNESRTKDRVRCESRVQDGIGRLTRPQAEHALNAADIPWGSFNQTRDVLSHPQLEATHRWTAAILPGGKQVPVLRDPFRFRDRVPAPPRPVADLGADTATVLAALAERTARIRDDLGTATPS